MKRFFPGQRVRLLRAPTKIEATVLRVGVFGRYHSHGGWIPGVNDGFDNGVEIDIPCNSLFPFCVYRPEDLEPIDPTGEMKEDQHERDTSDELAHVL